MCECMAARIRRTLRKSPVLKGTTELKRLVSSVSKIMKHKPVKKTRPKKK